MATLVQIAAGKRSGEMSKALVIHYAKNTGTYRAYCGSFGIASPRMKETTCKKCLAKLKSDEVIR